MASIINFLLFPHLFVILKNPLHSNVYSHSFPMYDKTILYQMQQSSVLQDSHINNPDWQVIYQKATSHIHHLYSFFAKFSAIVDLPTRLAHSNSTAYLSEYKFFHSNSLSYAFLQYLCLVLCAFLQNILSCRFTFSYLINCTINQKFKKSYTYRSCRTLLNRFFQNFLERQEH